MEFKNNHKICLIQIARTGDILQVLQLAKIFKETHSDIHLSLISRSQFGIPIKFLLEKVFDKLYFLDFKKIIREEFKSFKSVRDSINNNINIINNDNIDVLINLSFSKTSNYLCSSIKSKYKLGTRIDAYNKIAVTDQWSQLIFSMVMRGSNNPFNLIDIYKGILGLKHDSKSLKKIETRNKDLKVIVHPFSSHPKKHWHPHRWAEIFVSMLKSRRDLSIYLIGNASESEKADLITKNPILSNFKKRIKNLCGKTTMEDLYEILRASTHFIGHDSMVGHLAKIVNRPTLTFALGTVRPIETIPYGKNSFIVVPRTKCFPCFPKDKCNYYQCHDDISFHAAINIIESFLNEGRIDYNQIKKTTSSLYLKNLNIYEAYFHKTGLIDLRKINSNILSTKEVFSKLLRIGYLFRFLEKEERHEYFDLDMQTISQLENLKKGVQYLQELSEFGKEYSQKVFLEAKSEILSIDKIKKLCEQIDKIDCLKRQLGQSYPLLAPIIDFYDVVKSNMRQENILQLADTSFNIYQDCSLMNKVIHNLIEDTIIQSSFHSEKKLSEV